MEFRKKIIHAILSANISANDTLNFLKNFTRVKKFDVSIFNSTTIPIFILFAVICWLVNISMVITICVDRLHCLKKTSGWFVASISVASMISATSVILFVMQFDPKTKFKNRLYWASLLFSIAISATCVFNFIVIISVERFFLVVKPLQYRIFMTQKKAKCITVFTWVLSVVIGFVLLWFYIFHSKIYRYISFAVAGLVLFTILIDALTFYKLRTMNKDLKRLSDTAVQRGRTARLKVEKRFAQVVLLLLVNFVLLACPLYFFDGLVNLNFSCAGCIFAGKKVIGKLYFATLLALQFHDMNSALFYLIFIPKYRQSFIVNWKALFTYLKNNPDSNFADSSVRQSSADNRVV